MRIAVLGAGSLGFAYAAFLASRGHDVAIWSPSGAGIRGLVENGGRLRSDGKVVGEFVVRPCTDLQVAVDESDVVIFALPANGHETVMFSAAPFFRSAQIILVTPVAALSASVLAKYIADRGSNPLICASSTTMLTARRTAADSVDILSCRPVVDVSCLPDSETSRAVGVLATLFDASFLSQPNMLEATLSNTGPLVHVPLALMNMTRMERGESWLQYEQFTENVCRVIVALDRERIALCKAFGFSFDKIEDRLCRSFGARPGTLVDVAAQIVGLRNGGPRGPATAATRYLTEDVPFGLEFLSFVGTITGVPTPAINACITLAKIAVGERLDAENRLLDLLRHRVATRSDLLEAAAGLWE